MARTPKRERIEVVTTHEAIMFWVRVRPRCQGLPSTAGSWYCATHRLGFDNQFAKDGHIHTGKHKLAWICNEHGPEVP